MRYIVQINLFICLSLFFISCGTQQVESDLPAGLDKKHGAYSYIRGDREVSLLVDYEVARLRKDDKYFPLDVMIANNGLKSLTVTRESLILIDAEGKAYNMPTIDEIQKEYSNLWADSLFKYPSALSDEQALTSFTYYQVQRSNFFPRTSGAARVTDKVIIRPKGYIDDRLYFPMPDSGIEKKKLILRLVALELDMPFDVVFTIK